MNREDRFELAKSSLDSALKALDDSKKVESDVGSHMCITRALENSHVAQENIVRAIDSSDKNLLVHHGRYCLGHFSMFIEYLIGYTSTIIRKKVFN